MNIPLLNFKKNKLEKKKSFFELPSKTQKAILKKTAEDTGDLKKDLIKRYNLKYR